jgi:biopolymer transport protein ExbB
MQVLDSGAFELAEEVLYERLIPVREQLRRWLPFIAVTAAVAPLLGLLGTVSGLIKTFSVIAVEGTGEAQSISGGISEALITTLFGLSVAIPAFMAHALLSRRAKGIEQKSERLALVFLNEIRKHHSS